MKPIRILALILAAMTVVSLFASCGKEPEAETTAADTTAAVEVDATTEEALPVDDTTSEDAQTTEAAAEATEPEVTEAPTETTAAPTETTTAAAETTTETTTEEAKKAPTDKAEIITVYNDAIAKVVSNKVAFSKRRETKEKTFEAGLLLKAFKGVVYEFMGIGADNILIKSVAKNDGEYDRYIKKSSLSASDVNSATCTLNADDSYSITINVKNGNSYTSGGSGDQYNAPLDKSGISVGSGDKAYYDHKTAQNMYGPISEVSKEAVIDEKYSNATIKATIDKDGNLTKLDVTFDLDVKIDKVKGQSGQATGTTIINFSDFKW